MAARKEDIEKYALQNAVAFGGRANTNAVIGKLLKESPGLKDEIALLMPQVAKVVAEVNRLKPDLQKKMLEEQAPELLERPKPAKRELPELENAGMGKVVTRFPPEPSKHLHIGHALSFLINYMYAEKYNGKCILRFEDTNPATAKKEFVESIKQDITDYLQAKPSQVFAVSSHMPEFYAHAEKLIQMGKAYVCACSKERIGELRQKGDLCTCRTKAANLQEWREMLSGKHKEGSMVLRLVGDIQSPNMVMRDPVIFRISKDEHYIYRNKYCVWPMYDFENAIEDGTGGVTHIMRSIEFGQMRVELQDYIKDLLGLPRQTVVQYGRFNVTGTTTKGRELRELIKSRHYIGWDDPRLVTLSALRKRCIQPQTFRELALEVGLSKTQTNIDFSVIAAYNRKVLDPATRRFFMVAEPVSITIEGAPQQVAEIKNHPSNEKLGTRKYKVHERFYIDKKDLEQLQEGELVRLMDCLNFRKAKGKFLFDSLEYEKFRSKGKKVIHWLPYDEAVKAKLMMPDAQLKQVLVEAAAAKLKVGEVIQFTRVGFCSVEGRGAFWFGHE